MFKFDLHSLGFEYNKYWHDTRKQLEKEINAHVYIGYDTHFEEIKVIISLKNFNYNTTFYFPYNIQDLNGKKFNIINMIKENLQFRIYEDVFFISTNEVG